MLCRDIDCKTSARRSPASAKSSQRFLSFPGFLWVGPDEPGPVEPTGHWHSIATAWHDGKYVESSRRIGLRHAQIGLEPRW
ncbi:protoglobin domain-containing protein [Devosia riboflavina]|uniref:protoglobin domain-containing protein n=1 Tax=Devosia riboflavina TaxID=46914 RepID=UPI00126A5492|nr:protoglobin domain-containing protein [Devosia riboflavina]